MSGLGDWLHSIAIYTLLLEITDSRMAMATAMIMKLLPFVVITPFAGVVIDRSSRKRVMMLCELFSAFAVTGLLGVRAADDLWLLYLLTLAEVGLSAFFEPARHALLPFLVAREDLLAANALSGFTWSVLQAFGAVAGGVAVGLLGVRPAFVLNAVTFLLSAWIISRIPAVAGDTAAAVSAHQDGSFADALRYLRRQPLIAAFCGLKPGLAVAGGVMTLIPVLAGNFFSGAAALSLGVGIIYSARGAGAACGPLAARRLCGQSPPALQKSILVSFFLAGGCYLILSAAAALAGVILWIALAHVFSSIVWVFSTALIQMHAERRFLGRLFGLEMALLTLVMALSNGVVGYALDSWKLSAGDVALCTGLALWIPGLLWGGFMLLARARPEWAPAQASPATAVAGDGGWESSVHPPNPN